MQNVSAVLPKNAQVLGVNVRLPEPLRSKLVRTPLYGII